MRLDSHQHFWIYDQEQYPWIPKGSPLHRTWLPTDLSELQRPLGLEGSIAVQARQTLEESRWLLKLADENVNVRGVVGWVDLRANHATTQIAEFAQHAKFRGVRHVVQDEPDNDFMLGKEFHRGIAALHEFGLTYDILIYPRQLPAAVALVKAFPHQSFVLDHIAKPEITSGNMDPWREQIETLGKLPNVWCKVSGMITEADHRNWRPADLQPYLEAVEGAFGRDRLMWGSDWPVCLLAGAYEQTYGVVMDYAAKWSEAERNQLFGGTAARFYRIAG